MKDKLTLVIVESPAKSATISKYLGKEFVVASSMGHVRDLPPNILGIDVKNQFRPFYADLPAKKSIILDLKKKAAHCERVLLASDPDREGEAIAFHLQEILKAENDSIFRILLNEITPASVLAAVAKPLPIDMDKVNSQQMRRLLDRLAGYKISPVLQKKIGGPLSAGRVQSIALKLIVEREKEIQGFRTEEYWTVTAELSGSQPPAFKAKLEKHKGKGMAIDTKDQCDQIVSELASQSYVLRHVTKKLKKRKPQPPLITSTLQQEAFRRFKFPVKKTMQIAQELYEGVSLKGSEVTGLITYMRTDSYRIADQAKDQAREWIHNQLGKAYCPAKPNVYTTKKKTQDAHEAIRPTLPFYPPETIKQDLTPAQLKIYQLVWERFFASQMHEAEIQETIFDIHNGDYNFIARGEIIKFDGFFKMIKPDNPETQLPNLAENEILHLLELEAKQNFTKPPARFTEASLVKVLEDKGIGRPSTYAKIIDTLGKREYVHREEQKFVPTALGVTVVEYLGEHFKDIMNYNFTANLEKELDQVAEGSLDWAEGIKTFYQKLEKDLEKAKPHKKVALTLDRNCPRCSGQLIRKYSHRTRGWFIGCSRYPQCNYREKSDSSGVSLPAAEVLDKTCPQCGQALVKRFSPKTRRYFIGCSGFPRCKYIEPEHTDYGNCPQCGKPLANKFSPKTRRYFIGCSGYPDCKFIQKN